MADDIGMLLLPCAGQDGTVPGAAHGRRRWLGGIFRLERQGRPRAALASLAARRACTTR